MKTTMDVNKIVREATARFVRPTPKREPETPEEREARRQLHETREAEREREHAEEREARAKRLGYADGEEAGVAAARIVRRFNGGYRRPGQG